MTSKGDSKRKKKRKLSKQIRFYNNDNPLLLLLWELYLSCISLIIIQLFKICFDFVKESSQSGICNKNTMFEIL